MLDSPKCLRNTVREKRSRFFVPSSRWEMRGEEELHILVVGLLPQEWNQIVVVGKVKFRSSWLNFGPTPSTPEVTHYTFKANYLYWPIFILAWSWPTSENIFWWWTYFWTNFHSIWHQQDQNVDQCHECLVSFSFSWSGAGSMLPILMLLQCGKKSRRQKLLSRSRDGNTPILLNVNNIWEYFNAKRGHKS